MDGNERLLSISEVAEATGLRPSALRYYEDVGLIASATRRSGRRYFRRDVLDRLAIVALCQHVGFSIAEIGELFDEGPEARDHWRLLADRKLVELEARIEQARAVQRLLRAALGCDCGRPATCELVAEVTSTRPVRRLPTI